MNMNVINPGLRRPTKYQGQTKMGFPKENSHQSNYPPKQQPFLFLRIKEQFSDDVWILQHDGATCHKVKATLENTKSYHF